MSEMVSAIKRNDSGESFISFHFIPWDALLEGWEGKTYLNKLTFKQKPEKERGTYHVFIWQKSIP